MTAMMFWYGGHWAFWQAGLMWVGMIAFLGLLIWGIYALVSGATGRPNRTGRGGDALSILDERLARGEIDADEYRRLRELISPDSTRTPAGSGRAS
jgi:putative membrane protein